MEILFIPSSDKYCMNSEGICPLIFLTFISIIHYSEVMVHDTFSFFPAGHSRNENEINYCKAGE